MNKKIDEIKAFIITYCIVLFISIVSEILFLTVLGCFTDIEFSNVKFYIEMILLNMVILFFVIMIECFGLPANRKAVCEAIRIKIRSKE